MRFGVAASHMLPLFLLSVEAWNVPLYTVPCGEIASKRWQLGFVLRFLHKVAVSPSATPCWHFYTSDIELYGDMMSGVAISAALVACICTCNCAMVFRRCNMTPMNTKI